MPDATPTTLEFVIEFGEPTASPHIEVDPAVFVLEAPDDLYLGIALPGLPRPLKIQPRISARPRIRVFPPASPAVFPVPVVFPVVVPEATRPTVPFQTLWVGVDTESLTAALAVT